MQTLPVLKAIGAVFAFMLHHWRDVVRIAWAPVAVLVVGGFLIGLGLAGVQSGQITTPEEAIAAVSAGMPLLVGAMLLNVYVFLVIYAGLLKLLIRGERPKLPFYLGFGADEQRLLGSFLLVVFILFGIYLGAAVVAGIIAGLASALTGSNGRPSMDVEILLVGFVLGACLWFAARLFLAMPATVALGRIGVGPSWSRTKGTSLKVLLYLLFWMALAVAVEATYISIAVPGYFQFMGKVMSGETPAATDLPPGPAFGSLMWLADTLLSYAVSFLISVFGVTASGVAWRLLTDQDRTKSF